MEASAVANKTTLTQLRALDRFTSQKSLPSGTIDEVLALALLPVSSDVRPQKKETKESKASAPIAARH